MDDRPTTTADFAAAPTFAGAGRSAFELFDHSSPGPLNVTGFLSNSGNPGGPGMLFLPDPTLPNIAPANSGYVMQ